MDESKYNGDEESLDFKIKQTEKTIKDLKREVRSLLQQIPKELRGKFKL